jgi:uncharacterized membrane protein
VERQQEEFHMKKKTTNLRYLMELALLVAILLVMNITGLAMIPLPGQYASIMTVPVAIGAMMLGPLAGSVLGCVMGCISFYTAIKTGFSTMILAGYSGGLMILLSFVNTIVTRTLMGFCVGWIFKAVQKIDKTKTICYYVGGILAPVLNTVFYMTVLVIIFLNAPTLEAVLGAELLAKIHDNVILFVAAYVGVQAVIEAAVGCVISGSICKVLRVVRKS